MAKQPRTVKELGQWQQEYDRVEQEWLDWYRDYGSYFRTVSEAFHVFSEQWQGTTTFLDLKPAKKKRK